MDNKYVRGLVYVVVAMVILVGLLYLGDVIATAIANAKGQEAFGVTAAPLFGAENPLQGGWLPWIIIGGVVLYVIYVFFADSDMFKIGTREVVMMALGAALYGVLAFVFNIVPVPSVSLVALRPVVVIPIFFGFVFGPAVGFFTGAFGNVLGDALTGWGVFPIWDIGNGLMGLIPGLAGMYLMKKRGNSQILMWIGLAALAVATALVFLFPSVTNNFTGESMAIFQIAMPVILVVALAAAMAPKYWPYLFGLLTLGLIVWAVLEIMGTGFGGFAIVLLVVAIVAAAIAVYLYTKQKDMGKWLDDEDTRTLAIWATFAVVVGIGFAAIADIFYNGYSLETALVGEFVPAAGPNVLFAVVLTPLVYAAYKQARAGMGR